MLDIALIGHGAIAAHVAAHCPEGARVGAVICRPGRAAAARAALGDVSAMEAVADLPTRPGLLIDCAGHEGLRAHGPAALQSGIDLLTVSVGALADPELEADLARAAAEGGATLTLASGAIGALDALRAAARGADLEVTYRGRKPPAGWRGSRAEEVLDLDALTGAEVHFSGTAREAARLYPKNANVAAAVALAGAGFDATRAELIADPEAGGNLHEISARGSFGRFEFRIEGRALPGNPRSSALTALSVLAEIRRRLSGIRI